MKTLNNIVNEELIFERIIGFINDFKFSVDNDYKVKDDFKLLKNEI